MPIQCSCPGCHRPLRVPDDLLGKDVKCPSCMHVFVAATGEEFRAAASEAATSTASDGIREETGARRINRGDDRPTLSARRPRLDDDFDDDDFERPLRRRRLPPHRGGTVMTTGLLSVILSFVICPLIGLAGISAINMGKSDLRAMREGRMDPSGHGQTVAGLVMGIIGTVLGGLTILGFVAMIIIEAAG